MINSYARHLEIKIGHPTPRLAPRVNHRSFRPGPDSGNWRIYCVGLDVEQVYLLGPVIEKLL